MKKLLDLGAYPLLRDKHRRRTPVDLAANKAIKAAFAEHTEEVNITSKNKNDLLLLFGRLGVASRLPAVWRLVPISTISTMRASRSMASSSWLLGTNTT